jgi:hypothetical protein
VKYDGYAHMMNVLGTTPYPAKGDYSHMTPDQATKIARIEKRGEQYGAVRKKAGELARRKLKNMYPGHALQIDLGTLDFTRPGEMHDLIKGKS